MFYYQLLCFKVFVKSPNSFELDPAHYLSTLDCSWDIFLKFTDVDLKLIWDIEKYQFIENTIRDSIAMIAMIRS